MALDEERSFPRQDDLARLIPAIVVPLLVIGLVAFMLSRRRNGVAGRASAAASKSARRANQRGNRAMRRMVLSMVITVLENDMARRGAVAALKIARNRS